MTSCIRLKKHIQFHHLTSMHHEKKIHARFDVGVSTIISWKSLFVYHVNKAAIVWDKYFWQHTSGGRAMIFSNWKKTLLEIFAHSLSMNLLLAFPFIFLFRRWGSLPKVSEKEFIESKVHCFRIKISKCLIYMEDILFLHIAIDIITNMNNCNGICVRQVRQPNYFLQIFWVYNL